MDWKKETISPAEFERREREYISAAVAMMKRSTTPADDEKAEKLPPADVNTEENPVEDVSEEKNEDKSEGAEENKDKDDSTETDTEDSPKDIAEDAAEENPDKAGPTAESPGEFGVYTAGELTDPESGNEGLKKAAEILEEMTKNTAIMRKLVENSESRDGDVTDFPDFSFRESGNGGFRETGTESVARPRKNK